MGRQRGLGACIQPRSPAISADVRRNSAVILPPRAHHRARPRHRSQHRLEQSVIPQPPVEAFDKCVPRWLAKSDVAPLRVPFLRPARDRGKRPLTAALRGGSGVV